MLPTFVRATPDGTGTTIYVVVRQKDGWETTGLLFMINYLIINNKPVVHLLFIINYKFHVYKRIYIHKLVVNIQFDLFQIN